MTQFLSKRRSSLQTASHAKERLFPRRRYLLMHHFYLKVTRINSLNNNFDRTRCFSREQVPKLSRKIFKLPYESTTFISIFAILYLPTAFLTHFQQPRKLTKKKSKIHKIFKSLKPQLTLSRVWYNNNNNRTCQMI